MIGVVEDSRQGIGEHHQRLFKGDAVILEIRRCVSAPAAHDRTAAVGCKRVSDRSVQHEHLAGTVNVGLNSPAPLGDV